MLKKVLSIAILSSLSILSFADVEKSPNPDQVKKEITAKFKEFFGSDAINYLVETKQANSYLVLLNDGTSLIYFKDTNYAVVGDMYDLSIRKNLSGDLMAGFNKEIIDKIKDKGITFPVKDGVKEIDTVYVFTDPTCGYCRKLNSERDQYSERGIKLVYLPYSRSGENTLSYNELVDVWCSTDKVKAMDLAKNDKGSEIKLLPGYNVTDECKKAVEEGEFYGRSLGIKGTPALFSSSGNGFPGYIPANQLKGFLLDMKK